LNVLRKNRFRNVLSIARLPISLDTMDILEARPKNLPPAAIYCHL
jgi:hypothetical protein